MRQRVLTGLVVLLIGLNALALATLWFGLLRRPAPAAPGERPPASTGIDTTAPLASGQGRGFRALRERLELRPDQVERLAQLRREHFQRVRPLEQELFQTRQALYDGLFGGDVNDAEVETQARRLGRLQAELEHLRWQHFRQIWSLCDPNQRASLGVLLREMVTQARPPWGRGPGRGFGGPGRGTGRQGPPPGRGPGGWDEPPPDGP